MLNLAENIDDIDFIIEEKRRIAASFEYFLDEYVWIENKATNEPLKLELWPDQRKIIPIVLQSLLLIFLKAHQLGYTWLFVAAHVLWLSITKIMHEVVINSFNEDVGKEIMRRINFILDRLPEWAYPPIGKHNDLFLEFMHQDNIGIDAPSTIQIIPATEKGGQSKTPNVMIFDESCWNRYVARAYAGSLPGIIQAQGKIIIISNAIKTAPGWSWTRGIYTASMRNENDFNRVFLPWWSNPNRSQKILPDVFDGKGQPMTVFKQQMLRSGGYNGGAMDEEEFSQRYPETEEEAISALTGGYFGKTISRHDKFIRDNNIPGITGRLVKNKDGDIEFIEDNQGIITIWRWPYYEVDNWDGQLWTKMYAIGADISEGLGQSYSVAYVMDRRLDELVARIRSNRLDAVEFAEQLWLLSQWYCSALHQGGSDPALICAERTGAGQTTVKELHKKGANQYVQLIEDKTGGGPTRQLGWHESEQSKHLLMGDLKNWFRTTKGGFYCPILIDEASTTIKHEGSRRIGPEDETKFWDCVVAGGCTIQASYFLGGPPEKIIPPVTGWRARLAGEKKSPWVI